MTLLCLISDNYDAMVLDAAIFSMSFEFTWSCFGFLKHVLLLMVGAVGCLFV
jgi:hypothetical protein